MPDVALNARVSCESIDDPDGHPEIEMRRPIIASGVTATGSFAAPRMINLPLMRRPPITACMAAPLVTVAKTVVAPPSFVSAAAGSVLWLSM